MVFLFQLFGYSDQNDRSISGPMADHPHENPSNLSTKEAALSFTIPVDRDAWIDEFFFFNNYGVSPTLQVEQGNNKRSLLYFNLPTPTNQTWTRATLHIYLEAGQGQSVNVDAHRVTANWEEGFFDGFLGTVNWTNSIGLSFWSNLGGDFNPASMGTITTGSQGWRSVDLDITTVLDWANNPSTNYGLILLADSNTSRIDFTSKEGPSTQRAYLEIEYTIDVLDLENCTNGIDDDGDGLVDCADPDCEGSSYAISVVQDIGVTNETNALGAPDGAFAQIYDSGDRLTLDFGSILPAGSTYGVVWRRKTSYSGSTPADIRIEESTDNSNFTFNSFEPSTTSEIFITTPVVAENDFRYLRFRERTGSFDDFDLDAVIIQLCPPEICGNGVDNDGDGKIDCDDESCKGLKYAQTVVNEVGVVNSGNSVLAPDGRRARLYQTGDLLALDLGSEIAPGQQYAITWRRKPNYSGTALAEIILEESIDNLNWTTHPVRPSTTSKTAYIESPVVANVRTRYIRIRPADTNSDFDIDGVSFQICVPEICNNTLDDDGDGLVDGNDPDCFCPACLTPVVQEFYVPFPEDQTLQHFQTIYPSGSACGRSSPDPVDPVYTFVSIQPFLDSTIVFYDHWEDGYESEISNPTQSTTEIWGDLDLSNGYPPGYTNDVIFASDVIILENNVDPASLQTVIDYDGSDKFGSNFPIAASKASWATGSGTLFAGALEIYSSIDWGMNYVIPVGEDLTSAGPHFEYTGLIIMATENNTLINIDIDGNGVDDVITSLDEGESYLVDGGVQSGATVVGSFPIQVNVLTADRCDNYESRWYTLQESSEWGDHYYSAVNGPEQEYHFFNPNPYPITIKHETATGFLADIVLNPGESLWGAWSDAQVPPSSGHHFYTETGDVFHALFVYDGQSSTARLADWGAPLVPEGSLYQQILVGWGAGQDPTQSPGSLNASPVWLTAAYPSNSLSTGSIRVCIDYNSDNAGPLSGALGRNYDLEITMNEIESVKLYDPDGDQSGMMIFVCDTSDAVLTAHWGQDFDASGGNTLGLDLGTGIPSLNPFFTYKTASLVGDFDDNGLFSIGDTVQFSVGILNSGIIPMDQTFEVTDDFPFEMVYLENTTFLDDNVTVTSIPDGVNTPFPLDESGIQVDLELDPLEEAVIFFEGIITVFPNDTLITNEASVTSRGINYKPNVTLYISPTAEICENGLDDDGDGFIDCDCEATENLIYGEVFRDLNFNGYKEPGEDGVPNVPVYLYEDTNGSGVFEDGIDQRTDTSYTNINGVYDFKVFAGTIYQGQVSSGSDDAKERIDDGDVNIGSNRLHIGKGWTEANDRTITGFRFQNVSIPVGKTIISAKLRLTSFSNQSGQNNITIWGEDDVNPSPFTNLNSDISDRPRTTNLVIWNNVSNWQTGQVYESEDLSRIVQEIIDKPGWSQQSMSFFLEATDRRDAHSYDSDPNLAAELIVYYSDFPVFNFVGILDRTLPVDAFITTDSTTALSFESAAEFECETLFGLAIWEYACQDDLKTEVIRVGIENNLPTTINLTDTASIFQILAQATFDDSGGQPDSVTFTTTTETITTPLRPFTNSSDSYHWASLYPTSQVTLSLEDGGASSAGESLILYVLRQSDDIYNVGSFVHEKLVNDSHQVDLTIPSSVVPRDVTIEVPLSGIQNNATQTLVIVEAGSFSDTTIVNAPTDGNSVAFVEMFIEELPSGQDQVSVRVEAPSGGQEVLLSGAIQAFTDCPPVILVKTADRDTALVGETIIYTYRIYNTGFDILDNLSLDDDILGNIPIGQTNLDPGDSLILTANHIVQPADFPGPIFNTAVFTGYTPLATLATDTAYANVELVPSIGDYVWLDQNEDGIQNEDLNTAGINGVVVDLYNTDCASLLSSSVPFKSVTTSNHPSTGYPGYYRFDTIPDGNYCIKLSNANFATGQPLFSRGITQKDIGGDDNLDSDADAFFSAGITMSDSTDLSLDFGLVQYVMDFGDAPSSYNTFSYENGPLHLIPSSPNLYLGSTVDSELEASPSQYADGDGSDEDGVVVLQRENWTVGNSVISEGNVVSGGLLQIEVTGNGHLVSWIDWNLDGSFSGDMTLDTALTAGIHQIPIDIPVGANMLDHLYSRFRLFQSRPVNPSDAYSGIATFGEVEDMMILAPCILDVSVVSGPCVNDQSDVTITVTWSGPPIGEDISVEIDGTVYTIPVSTGATSPHVIVHTMAADGSCGNVVDAYFSPTTSCSDSEFFNLPPPCVLPPSTNDPCVDGPNTVGGNVFRDFNSNGIQEVEETAGIENISVTAYAPDGTIYGPDITDEFGDWYLTIPDGVQVRIEFTTIPAAYLNTSTFNGINSRTTVQFVTSPSCNIDLGVNDAADNCN